MITQIPFDQAKKIKIVVRKDPIDSTQVNIVVKGAPEYLIYYCVDTYNYLAQ
jgi:hypothetical protein